MPRVPAYGGRKVETAPVPGVRRTAAPTAESMGADIGDLVARIGTENYVQIHAEERQRQDEVALLAANRHLGNLELSLVHDPINGALTVKGLDAVGNTTKVLEAFDTQAARIEGELANDRQKAAFRRQREAKRFGIRATVEQHAGVQLRGYEQTEHAAAMATAQQTAIANAADPRRVAAAVADQDAMIEQTARHLGLGPAVVDQLKAEARSTTYVGVIDRLLAQGHDKAARAYFDAAKDQISGDQLAKIERALEEGSTRGESQRQADAIMRSSTSLEEALEQVQAITDPKLRDATEARVKSAYTARTVAEGEAHDGRVINAYNVVDKSGSIDSIAPSDWTTFTGGERAGLKAYAKQKREGVDPETDLARYYDLVTLASSKPADFLTTNLLKDRHRLSESDFKHLTTLQANMRSGSAAAADKLLASDTLQKQMADQALRSVNIDPNPPEPGSPKYNKATTDRVIEFRRVLREGVARLEAATGKPATDKDVQAIVDTLVAQTGVTDGGWFGRDKPTYVFETPKAAVTSVSQVPAEERRQIEDTLRRAKFPVTDAAIVQLFNLKIADVKGER